MSYTPNYKDIDALPNNLSPTGFTARECVTIEESAQKSVAENEEWLLARKLNYGEDSRDGLEALGIKVLGTHDELFYTVLPPEGWTKKTSGFWTSVYNLDGKEIISQFFKGAFYDKDAFLNILK